jgi:hypothetical protein
MESFANSIHIEERIKLFASGSQKRSETIGHSANPERNSTRGIWLSVEYGKKYMRAK